MSYIDKDATLAVIANKAKAELADVNHYFLEGVQLAVDVVEGMTDVSSCDGCRYGYFGSAKCDRCSRMYPDHYEEDSNE